jgi:hypothetical protein
MINPRIAAIGLIVAVGAVKATAQPDTDKHNPALATLRAGAWLERGGLDSFEPKRGMGGEFHAVAVSWDMPQLSPPQLIPPIVWAGPAPVVVETPRVEAARPIQRIEPARPIERGQSVPAGMTPCQDLIAKANRLRNAAEQCDADMAAGRSSCSVVPQFQVPIISRSLSANGARSSAAQFESVASVGSEQSCAEYGGEGSLTLVVPVPMETPRRDSPRRRCMDSYLRENYNDFVANILVPYFSIGSVASKAYWESVLESAVVKGSILGALGLGRAHYSTVQFEALGKSLTDWGWLGIAARRNAIVGAGARAGYLAMASAFLEAVVGVVVAGWETPNLSQNHELVWTDRRLAEPRRCGAFVHRRCGARERPEPAINAIACRVADRLFLERYMRGLLLIRNETIKRAAESDGWRWYLAV